MNKICDTMIRDLMAWTAESLDLNACTYVLNDADRDELDRAMSLVREADFKCGEFSWGDFPLDGFRAKINAARLQVQEETGIALLRGIPVDRYSRTELDTLFWGIGVHLGIPVGQNRRGDRLVKVEATPDAPPARVGDRGYWQPAALPFHTDFSDMVALLCVNKARSGGACLAVSTLALHNHILAHRPDLLPPLYEGMFTTLRNEGPRRSGDECSPEPVKIFEYHHGKLSSFFALGRFLGGQETSGIALSPLQMEALQYLSDLAQKPEYQCTMILEPGDIQLLNNYVTLHARTDYEDFEEANRRRLLLRLWLRFDQENYRLSPERSRLFRWGMDAVRPLLV